MRSRAVLANLGTIVRLFSFALLLPAIPAVVYEAEGPGYELPTGVFLPEHAALFLSLFVFCFALGFFLERFAGEEEIREAEGFVLVGVGYLVVAALGALPYLLTGAIPSPLDAYFESMSGFTTVGATVMRFPLEAHPPSVMFWRSLTQWLGGMGIIVLSVALLPRLVESGGAMLRAEFSGGGVRLRPKLAETARSLWGIYALLTVAGAALIALVLWLEGMAPNAAIFDGVNHAFTAIATGGFSTHTDSVAYFRSAAVELILAALMIAGAVSFVLHYRALHGEGREAYRDEEFLFFGALLVGVTLGSTIILFLFGTPDAWAGLGGAPDLLRALRAGFFTVVSVLTTTGYATVNYDAWPDASRILLILLMVVGGMVGSTAGGIKTMRILVLGKLLLRETMRIVHPRAVLHVRLRREIVEDRTLHMIASLFFAYLAVAIVSTILLSFTGLDIIASFTSAAATLGGLGPAMGGIVGGPMFTYEAVHPLAKIVLILDMWFGRLEIFAALLLLLPSTYRRA